MQQPNEKQPGGQEKPSSGMTAEARKLWNSPQGCALLEKMLRRQPLTDADKETLSRIKKA